MADLVLLTVVFSAAMNGPASIASRPEAFADVSRSRRAALAVGAWIAAAAMLAFAVPLHGWLLEVFDISAPTFELAAGVVMLAGDVERLIAEGLVADQSREQHLPCPAGAPATLVTKLVLAPPHGGAPTTP